MTHPIQAQAMNAQGPEIQGPEIPGMKDATLCFLLRGTPPATILLGHKKRGFGAGKWAGIGGRIEAGESVEAAARREVDEEIGVTIPAADLHSRGVITFRFPQRPTWNQTVHLFVATHWIGEPAESEEMRPAWYATDNMPYDQMWGDARHWMARLLAGETLHLLITFSADNETVSTVTPLVATPPAI
jgi:8-oxo-dGTP diphosphatase